MALDSLALALQDGPAHRFHEWPPTDFTVGPSGVYTIWNGPEFLYVGMAWQHRGDTNEKAKGVFGRLASHASGRRSGDQFCIYICDRYVIPHLTDDELRQLGNGARILDQRTRDYIRTTLTYRVVFTDSGAHARELEHHIRRHGLPAAGHPAINPATVTGDSTI